MDARKLSNTLLGFGAAALAGAFFWWIAFYNEVIKQVGSRNDNVFDVISCLWSNGGVCGFVGGFAQMAGHTPYSPAVFWVGAALLFAGIVIRMAIPGSSVGGVVTAEGIAAAIKPYIPYIKSILVVAVVTAIYWPGWLDFIENKLTDVRFRLAQSQASGRLVVVKFDATSLQEIGVWPWPRSFYADLLDRLFAAGAADVALDIDFSSTSIPAEDARLAETLARYGTRVILPVFKQEDRQADDRSPKYIEPVPQFRAHTRVASLDVSPDPDGVVRQTNIADLWRSGFVPRLPAMLAGADRERSDSYYIDYGIQVQSIPQLSFVSVLNGSFDPAVIRDRHVIVGASAAELGDGLPVPVWGVLPGTFVQAVAVESLLQGRDLHRAPKLPISVVTLLIIVLAGSRFGIWSWRMGLAATGAIIAGVEALAILVQMNAPILVDTAPCVIATLLAYGVGLTDRIWSR